MSIHLWYEPPNSKTGKSVCARCGHPGPRDLPCDGDDQNVAALIQSVLRGRDNLRGQLLRLSRALRFLATFSRENPGGNGPDVEELAELLRKSEGEE